MKHLTLVLIILSLGDSLFSQNTKPTLTSNSVQKSLHLNVFRNSIKSGDYLTAIIALNYVVAIESTSGKYQDSLAMLYFMSSNFQQSLYWSEQVITKQPQNKQMIEIKAASLKNTKQYSLAITEYEKLVNIDPNPIYVYNLIELQYQIKRLYECILTSQLIEKLEFTNEMKITYIVGENQQKTTSIKSAMLNYMGLAYFEIGKNDIAKQAFEHAISIDSSFVLAKENLNKLNTAQDKNTPIESNEEKKADLITEPRKD